MLNVDLAPTFLEFAGVSLPASIEGRSLVPILRGDANGWRTSFAAEYYDKVPFPRIPTWEAVSTQRFKLIRFPQLGREFNELYDLSRDPYELTNAVTTNPEEVPRLEDLLDQLLAAMPASPSC